jgi:integrase
MSRTRPADNPVSYHKHTGQYYITRAGKRIYLGADKIEALQRYHRISLGQDMLPQEAKADPNISLKELANRFIAAQSANWKNPKVTLMSYKQWLKRFLEDHSRLKASQFTVERFADWKLSLKAQGYAPETINHFLCAVRAIFSFAEDTGLIEKAPKLGRIKNESPPPLGAKEKPLYSPQQIQSLIKNAGFQLKAMLLLALNCGFGPKDLHDLKWEDIEGERVTLPRSKTGVCQTYLLWAETYDSLQKIRQTRAAQIFKLAKKGTHRNDTGHVFVTYCWKPWNKDAIAEEFRKLCKKADVPCYGIYRMRHCASTAISMVASPHVQRKFMRHSQLQQQTTYTHTPDAEVDKAIAKARRKLLNCKASSATEENNHEQSQVA